MKTCCYCKKKISEDAILEVCDNCGRGVWGDKTYKAIIANMREAKERGDI